MLRTAFRERRLSLGTMDRPLRLATVGAFASFVATALGIVFRGATDPHVSLGRGAEGSYEIGLPSFGLSLVLVAIGLGYLLTAACLLKPTVGVPALALMLLGIGWYSGAFGGESDPTGIIDFLPDTAALASRLLLICLALVAIATVVVNHRAQPRHVMRRHHLVALVTTSVIFGAYWLLLAIESPTVGSYYLFGPSIAVLLQSLSFAIYPLLYVAAVDFGEWGELTGARIVAAFRRSDAVIYVLAAVALTAYGIYAVVRLNSRSSWGATLASVGRGVAFAVLIGGPLYLALRRLRARSYRWPDTLGFAPLLGVAAVALIAPHFAGYLNGDFRIPTPTLATADGRYGPGADVVAVERGVGTSMFTMLIPRYWTVDPPTDDGSLSATWIYGRHADDVVAIASTPPVPLSKLDQVVSGQLTNTTTIGRWSRADLTPSDPGVPPGNIWTRTTDVDGVAMQYVLLTTKIRNSADESIEADRVFAAMADSLRTATEEPAEAPPLIDEDAFDAHSNRRSVIQAGLLLTASFVALALVLIRRRIAVRFAAAGLLVVMVTAMEIVISMPALSRFLFGNGAGWPLIDADATFAGIALLGVAALALTASAGKRSPRLAAGLLGLVGAIAALDLMNRLYAYALAASDIAVWAAVILLVAVSWDIVMSGESMTNRGSNLFPRPARLLGVCGYMIVLCGLVLFFSAQTDADTDNFVEPFFEPEAVTQSALFYFAFPLFVLMFFMRLMNPVTIGTNVVRGVGQRAGP